MSLIREARKLQASAETLLQTHSPGSLEFTDTPASKALQAASDYIVNFNMKGLHRIEKELFFPWAIKKITDAAVETDVAVAFRDLMNQLEQDQKALVALGDSLVVSKFLELSMRKCL